MSSHRRLSSRGDASSTIESNSNAGNNTKPVPDTNGGGHQPKQLSTSKSVSSMYISSVLAASAASGIESPNSGGKSRDTIYKAAERGNTDAVLAFIRKKKSVVNARNDLGHVPLHIAALHNCYDVVAALLRNEADVNLRDNVGWTALHFAASGKSEKLIQLLLDHPKIDVNITNDSLNTPLHYAAKNFLGLSRVTLRSFLERGANVNAQNAMGETPMHGAALKNHHVMIERLIEAGASTDIPTNQGETPLNWATKGGDVKTISALLRSHKGAESAAQAKSQLSGRASMSADSGTTATDLRYELTFMASEEIVLSDDNWDQCLYDGGIQLMVDSTESVVVVPKPNMYSVKYENLPLSKLFHLYLVISGRNKTDPEIVHWIVDFLTGPKKLYLQHLIDHFSYRIRARPASSIPQSQKPSPPLGRSPISQNSSSTTADGSAATNGPEVNDIFKQPTEKDEHLFNLVFSEPNSQHTMPRTWMEDMEDSSDGEYVIAPYSARSSSDILNTSGGSDSSGLPSLNGIASLSPGPKPMAGGPLYAHHVKAHSRDRSVSLWEHRTRVSRFHWEISPNSLQVYEKLGAGAFGTVYRAKWMGTEVALKILDSSDYTPDEYREFLAEISMMSNLRHPNVLIMLGGSLVPPNLYFVTEYMRQGSLDKLLNMLPNLSWRVRLQIALDIARGLYYLHHQSPPILHRDLKSLNILIDEHFRAKLADFGLSADKSDHLKTKMGTLNWVAPEMVNITGRKYDEKCDMWSFGMILWELVSFKIPFSNMSQLQTLRRIDMHELEPIPEGTDARYAALIQWCWHQDPNKRPSIADALDALEDVFARP